LGVIRKSKMILGIGIDIIEVARIKASHEKFGERFASRILLPDEIAYCLSHKNPAPFLAVRFAAKEAVSKAFGTGIGAALGWRDMEIRRKESGEPFVILHGNGKTLFESRQAQRLLVSLSHTENYAAATAILEG
jgi:holo-[acyl-carrier protein] synthase